MEHKTERIDRLLRVDQFIPEILPISKTSWWNGVKSGKYPKPIKLGKGTTCWRESEIMAIVSGGVNQKAA